MTNRDTSTDEQKETILLFSFVIKRAYRQGRQLNVLSSKVDSSVSFKSVPELTYSAGTKTKPVVLEPRGHIMADELVGTMRGCSYADSSISLRSA